MDKPIRIQRKIIKGFKLPENTICVTRGTKYGNPFRVVKIGKEWFIKCSSNSDKQAQIIVLICHFAYHSKDEAVSDAIKCFKVWLDYSKLDVSPLKGKNVACWCNLADECHADELLKIANK